MMCPRCQGNGEIVTDWDKYSSPNHAAVGADDADHGIMECPECDGTGRTAPTTETAWLIESGSRTYWSGHSATNFTTDNSEACRFSRREDAERVIFWLIAAANPELSKALRASEHVWIGKS